MADPLNDGEKLLRLMGMILPGRTDQGRLRPEFQFRFAANPKQHGLVRMAQVSAQPR